MVGFPRRIWGSPLGGHLVAAAAGKGPRTDSPLEDAHAPAAHLPGTEDMTTVLLPVYSRLDSALQMARRAVACDAIDDVVVSLHHPDIDRELFHSAGAHVVDTKVERPGGYRWFALGVSLPDLVVSIDDDTLLTDNQLGALVQAVQAEPLRPHGVIGSRYPSRPFVSAAGRARNLYFERSSRKVDALHQVYAATADHVTRYRRLATELESFDPFTAGSYGEDLILSICGRAAARIHDLGPIEEVPSSWDPSVAVHGRPNFDAKRAAVLEELDRRGLRWASAEPADLDLPMAY